VERYFNNVQTQFGAPAAYSTITVYEHGTTTPPPQGLWSDNGVTALANPFQSDINGNFGFYTFDGHYDVYITGPNLTPYTVSDILLNDTTFGPDNVGPTSSRPAVPTLNQQYQDTTLGLPIWCKQVSPPIWINAAGVQV